MGIKVLWTLALFMLSCTSNSQGEFTKETITYLRLLNGESTGSTYTGRVVIRVNNEPVDGAICGTWTRNEAIVACRMLGYNDGNSVAYESKYGSGSHNFLMSNLRCTGQEQSLSDCPKDTTVNCQYESLDVVVSCSNPGVSPVATYDNGTVNQFRVPGTPVPPASVNDFSEYTNCSTQGNIRLHGITNRPGMGYVQVYVNGVWQYICDDRWSENDAKVVCRELCYTGPACARPGIENQYRLPINDNQVNFAWNTVHCTGDETSLSNCAKSTTVPTGQCRPQELAGVQCVVPPDPVKTMNADLQCSALNEDIVLQFSQTEFPNLNQNSLKILNPGARSDCVSATRISPVNGGLQVRISPQDCGTKKTDNGSDICYSNKVLYDNEVFQGNVLLDYKKKTFTVTCCLATDKDVSIKFVPKTQESAQSYSKSYDYTPEISFYQNERCDVKITDNPYSVEVGDWVYIGISVKAENMSIFIDNDLKLVVERCTANPIRGVLDSNYPENVTLIRNKCRADIASVTTYPVSNTTEGFRFRAFKFFGYSSVYITCHLRVCLATDPKPQCDRSCLDTNGLGRKRRTVGDTLNGLDTVVSQVLQITDPKEPKVNTQIQEDGTAERINPRFIKH